MGRTEELHIVHDFLFGAGHDKKVLNIYGTGGIGKSFLLDEVGRRVTERSIPFVRLDSRDFHHTPADLADRIASVFGPYAENMDDRRYAEASNCIDMINDYAQIRGLVVIAFDMYEEMNEVDAWIRDFFIAELSHHARVLIAGRKPLAGSWIASPAWRRILLSMPLHSFNRETCKDYISRFEQINDIEAENIYSFTKGHPLTLSLVMALSPSDRPGFTGIDRYGDTTQTIPELVSIWLREVPEELRNLIEAASVVRSFNKEMLEWLLVCPVAAPAFDAITRLSFVRFHPGNGWIMHDLLRHALASQFLHRSPKLYFKLMERSALFYRQQLALPSIPHISNVITNLYYVLGGSLMRTAYLANSPADECYVEDIDGDNVHEVVQYLERRARETHNYRKLFWDQSGRFEDGEEMLAAFERNIIPLLDPYLFIQFGRDTIRMVKKSTGEIAGLVVAIPIHRGSFPFLASFPITKNYVQTLSDEHLKEHLSLPDRPAGWFFFHAETRVDADHGVQSEVTRMMNHLYANRRLILFSTPLEENWRIAACLGYEEVEGAAHYAYGDKFPSRTFCLDLRGRKLHDHFDALIQNAFPDMPATPGRGFGFTSREKEVAALVVEGLSNKEIALKLFISEIAAKKHVSNLLKKAGVGSRTQLVKRLTDSTG